MVPIVLRFDRKRVSPPFGCASLRGLYPGSARLTTGVQVGVVQGNGAPLDSINVLERKVVLDTGVPGCPGPAVSVSNTVPFMRTW
jgi:hypothetical protein